MVCVTWVEVLEQNKKKTIIIITRMFKKNRCLIIIQISE